MSVWPVILDNVFVAYKMLVSAGSKHSLEPVQIVGFIWFELLMCASYLGACAGLVEQVVDRGRWNESDRVDLASEIQLVLAALEGSATDVEANQTELDDVLARLLLVRYGIEGLLARASDKAHEMLGGMNFIQSNDSTWLLSCRGLRFHPPARISMYGNLASYISGKKFSMTKD